MKELKLYLIITVVLALIWHKDQWLSHPMEHLLALPNGGAFGVPGLIHPLVFALGIYLFIGLPRLMFRKKEK